MCIWICVWLHVALDLAMYVASCDVSVCIFLDEKIFAAGSASAFFRYNIQYSLCRSVDILLFSLTKKKKQTNNTSEQQQQHQARKKAPNKKTNSIILHVFSQTEKRNNNKMKMPCQYVEHELILLDVFRSDSMTMQKKIRMSERPMRK